MNETFKAPWFVKGDIDGFFGLAIDNLIQFLLIATLCPLIAGIPAEFVYSRVLPGAALSVVFGYACFAAVFLLFHLWQRQRRKKGLPEEILVDERRCGVTADGDI